MRGTFTISNLTERGLLNGLLTDKRGKGRMCYPSRRRAGAGRDIRPGKPASRY